VREIAGRRSASLSRRGNAAHGVTVAVVTPDGAHRERVVFLGGSLGRGRGAIATAAILLSRLR
jgi:hypothetical protein